MNRLSTRSVNDLEAAGGISKTQQNDLGEKPNSAGNRKCLYLWRGAELSLSHSDLSSTFCAVPLTTTPAYTYLVLQFSKEKSSSESVILKMKEKGTNFRVARCISSAT